MNDLTQEQVQHLAWTQTLSKMTWIEAYEHLIDDLTIEEAQNILRCMSNSTKLYQYLKGFVENSLDD